MGQGLGVWKIVAYLMLLALVGALATLLNPYGADLHRWLIGALAVPRPEIQEWHPPVWFASSAIKWWVLMGLMLGGLACLAASA